MVTVDTRSILVLGFECAIAIALLFIASNLRVPAVANLRNGLLGLVQLASVGLILIVLVQLKLVQLKQSVQAQKAMSYLAIALAVCSLTVAVGIEANFQLTKQRVLNADPQKLSLLGQHFIVGYRSFPEVKQLVEKRAIAGIFLTTRNIENRRKDEIAAEIRALQSIRQEQQLPPLWVAADQEGGVVSRLSPPLTQLPALSSIPAEKQKITDYARIQAQELSEVGVNLNFAPVVDLNKGVINPRDRYSRIYQRAISADPTIVARVATWYCQTLETFQVRCTIKHFPGLGGVSNDTHVEAAHLTTPIAELAQKDWLPFRQLMQSTNAFVMVGHVIVSALDPDHPVSFSKAIVADLLRQQWQFKGVLVTDDFCMQAVYASQMGLAKAVVHALNDGVDLILTAFDSDVYYTAMDSLLQAEHRGDLNNQSLIASQKRLVLAHQLINHASPTR